MGDDLIRNYKVIDESGLHARPAAKFVKTMVSLGISARITHGDRVANYRSILEALSLGINCGTLISPRFQSIIPRFSTKRKRS
jgi:phosphocarrier protein